MNDKPEQLSLLCLEDHPEPANYAQMSQLPLKYHQIKNWKLFCEDLSRGDLPRFHLLTMDFCFDEDRSTPAKGEKGQVHNDYLEEPLLSNLAWSPHLLFTNSGVLMGATLACLGVYRDIPIGAAVYTGYPILVSQDMTTAMLVTQILATCGVPLNFHNTAEMLRSTLAYIHDAPANCVGAIPFALEHFRNQLLKRARDGQPLLVDSEQIHRLLSLCETVHDETSLNSQLDKMGLKLTDNDATCHHFDLRSLFADKLIRMKKIAGKNDVEGIQPSLSLSEFKEGGDILRFLTELKQKELDHGKIIDFFDHDLGTPERSVKEVFQDKHERLIVLVIGWCLAYMENYKLFSEPWDPFNDEYDVATEQETMPRQLKSLMQIFNACELVPLPPISCSKGVSLTKVIKRAVSNDPDHPLYRSLRYEQEGLTNKRKTAISRMVDRLVEFNCLKPLVQGDQVMGYAIKAQQPRLVSRVKNEQLYEKLGYSRGSWNPIMQIVEAMGFSPGHDFVNNLNKQALPEFLRQPVLNYLDDGEEGNLLDKEYCPPCLII